MEVIDRYDGRPFPSWASVGRGWVDRPGPPRSRTSLETMYCAELVATTYQAMGILPDKRPASFYDPGTFWSGDQIELVPPYVLGGEIPVTSLRPTRIGRSPAATEPQAGSRHIAHTGGQSAQRSSRVTSNPCRSYSARFRGDRRLEVGRLARRVGHVEHGSRSSAEPTPVP